MKSIKILPMSGFTQRIVIAVCVGCILPSCIQRSSYPDLGEVYNRSAQSPETERDPVIVIPGILGSRLKDSTSGRSVWGAFLGGFANPNTPEGARLVALPLSRGEELNSLPTTVRPDGVLGKIQVSLLGLPVELNAYKNILEALGSGGYRDKEIAMAGVIDYGSEHFTCFQFPYDWRRDISHSAAELHKFILKEKAYVEAQLEQRFGEGKDIKFTLVAHSMGGLVARYYLRYGPQIITEGKPLPELNWAGAKLVKRLVMVGTPNAGSIFAFRDLLEGKDLGPVVPTYSSAILATMPSVYQLLPRSRHKAYEYFDGKPVGDILDPNLWQKHEWGLASRTQDEFLKILLPDVESASERREIALEHLKASLKRAKAFQLAMDKPASPPAGLDITLFAADSIPTPRKVRIDRRTGTVQLSSPFPGDGLVARSSALLDERVGGKWQAKLISPVTWNQVTFINADHLGLTESPAFINNVLFTLLEKPLPQEEFL